MAPCRISRSQHHFTPEESPMSEDRLDELEIRLAFQDKLIHELESLVRSFGDRLDETRRELAQLKEALKSPEVPLGAPNEKPPHY
jgi:uncharacterized coiled-coil protein SlyX